jgi:hypothetical protein
MEPRQDEPKRAPEHRKDEKKGRFQITKLEERITPHRVCYTYHGRTYCYKHSHGGGHGRP